jgi:hypothetical protein
MAFELFSQSNQLQGFHYHMELRDATPSFHLGQLLLKARHFAILLAAVYIAIMHSD